MGKTNIFIDIQKCSEIILKMLRCVSFSKMFKYLLFNASVPYLIKSGPFFTRVIVITDTNI